MYSTTNSTSHNGLTTSQIIDDAVAAAMALEQRDSAGIGELRGTLLASIVKLRNHLDIIEGLLLSDAFPQIPDSLRVNYSVVTAEGLIPLSALPDVDLNTIHQGPQVQVPGAEQHGPASATKLQCKPRKFQLIRHLPGCIRYREICEHRRMMQRHQQLDRERVQIHQAKRAGLRQPPPTPAGKQPVQLCKFHAEEVKNKKAAARSKKA